MTLLDTCVVIDVLRNRTGAVDFVSALPGPPSVSVVTVTELLGGVRDEAERREVERLLAVYSVIDIGLEIGTLAGDFLKRFGRSHAVDPLDALIAATAKSAELELATLNLKHFPMFKGLKRPYKA